MAETIVSKVQRGQTRAKYPLAPLASSSFQKKITSSATNLFFCLELRGKQLLQAFNADAVILDGCASSRVDNYI